MANQDKEFLFSVKSVTPRWELFMYPDAAKLPAVQWKIRNISRMAENKRISSFNKLEKVLRHGSNH